MLLTRMWQLLEVVLLVGQLNKRRGKLLTDIGTYSAISLKDKGKSVVVIEKQGRLGGHTETFKDPVTGVGIDMGVIIFHNTQFVRDYFGRFDIPLIVAGSDTDPGQAPQQVTYDFKTGKAVAADNPTQEEVGAAIAGYIQQLSKYPELDNGMFLPDPVPEDLTMPFRHFVEKYKLEAILPTLFFYNQGIGDINTLPTVEMMKTFGLSLMANFSPGFLTTQRHNNSELYGKAQDELQSANSLLLNSNVEVAMRLKGKHGVKLIVKSPSGRKLIRAKRLLITIPTKLELMAPFNPTAAERAVFSKWINAGYYTTILKNTGVPDTLTIANGAPGTEYNLSTMPGIYMLQPGAPGLSQCFYGSQRSTSTHPLPEDTVKSDIINGVKRIQAENPDKFQQTEPEFVRFKSHTPFYLHVSGEDTKAGFYDKLYALQGTKNTFYTGASFRGQDSSLLWRFSEEVVLPKLLEGQ
jgi:hypothetical protein